VFCLQCGAEAPARAVNCSVCGHDLGRTSADLRGSMTLTEIPLQSSNSGILTSHRAALPLPASPSIQAGDLDQPGLPKDAIGRVLLIVILGLAADLFLPWRVVYGQHETLPLELAAAIAALVVLAAVPLFHPKLRRYTISAALPIVVGGTCLGLGAAFWAYLVHSNDLSAVSCQGILCHNAIDPNSIGPDFGLFCFMVLAAILVVIGYYLFLAAARVSPLAASALATAHAAAMPSTRRVLTASSLVATSSQATESKPNAVPPAVTPPQPGDPHSTGNSEGQDAYPPATISARPSTAKIALPGTDLWNRTLEPPTFLRPKAGSIRRSNR
jgi:hypothetical protein